VGHFPIGRRVGQQEVGTGTNSRLVGQMTGLALLPEQRANQKLR